MSKKLKYLTEALIIEMELNDSINYLYNIMHKHIIKAGIPEVSYSRVHKIVNNDHKLELKNYLLNIYLNEHEEVRKAWNHLPEEAWEKYKVLYNETNTREHIVLFNAQKLLRNKWRARPEFLKRKRKENKINNKTGNTEITE